ncbi:hypothetical protein HPT25_12280 [Bacillus sp. BRMEA1]|uniref:hypothetical protein n=1 Tax=Neobacillus endophyticus TaxID=2738405 RepID=UPI0015663E58|nr:hypothetical protein [Neobacillus endophyticus]NRD78164.1 hypothetical protein [Neobacillus endophyticus]
MKIRKAIGTSLISISLLGLFGCQTNTTSSQAQQSNSSTDQPKTDPTQQTQDSQKNGNAGNGNQATQNGSSNQNSSSNQSGHSDQNTPPRTKQEALNKIAKSLKTKVPFILPKNVPLDTGKYLTATTSSQSWYYQIQLFQTNNPVNINTLAAPKGTWIATLEGTEYKDSASAEQAINGYILADTTQNSIDLGHGIKGTMDAATGHSYIIWNEGRWSIKLDSPNDPTYQNKNYPDSLKLAQKIVAYLNTHTLPAPQKIGVITIHNWQQNQETTIEWQYHEMTYKVTSSDPLKALEIATQMR